MPSRSVILYITGVCLSLQLTLTGVLLLRRGKIIAGACVLLVSVVLFLISARAVEKRSLSDEEAAALKPYLFPILFWNASLVISVLVLFGISNPYRPIAQDKLTMAGWPLAILCLVIGTLWASRSRFPGWNTIKQWLKAHAIECAVLCTLLILGLTLRLVLLDQHPFPWSGDEASIGTEGRKILDGQNLRMFATGWSGQPYWSFVPTALSMAIWGETIFGIRMVSAVVGTLTILSLYLLAREAFNKEIAMIAAAFLVTFPYHLQFSRIGVHNIFDGLMVTLVLWLVFRSFRTGKVTHYMWAGIATGLTFYTYVGSRLVLAIALSTIGYVIIVKRGYLRTYLRQLAVFLAGLMTTIAPIAYFFITNQSNFMTRIIQENILLNGWLESYTAMTGLSTTQVILDQISRTLLVYVSQNAYSGFLNSPYPYLSVVGSMLFLIGLGVAFRYILKPSYLALQIWFWSVVTLGGILTLNPPASTRLVMSIPAVALFVALGWWAVISVLKRFKVKSRWLIALTAILLVSFAVQNLLFYFGEYRQNYYFRDANSELAMEAGLELQQLGPQYNFYLLGYPRVFIGFPTIHFLAPENYLYDLTDEKVKDLDIPSTQAAIIVAIPENIDALRQIAEDFPGGEWETVQRKTQVEVLYYAYILHPSAGEPP